MHLENHNLIFFHPPGEHFSAHVPGPQPRDILRHHQVNDGSKNIFYASKYFLQFLVPLCAAAAAAVLVLGPRLPSHHLLLRRGRQVEITEAQQS